MSSAPKIYDVVLWGATGFTGKIVAKYLAEHYTVGELKWAIAGRNEKNLRSLAQSFSPQIIDCLIADAKDPESLQAICSKTKVVCTVVGPYSLYGDDLIKACVETNTHYCDLTGEVPWMKKNITLYHDIAKEKKLKIVHSCGFDSIPSDIGVYHTQNEFFKKTGVYAEKIEGRVSRIKGSFSGGTYASMNHLMEEVHRTPELKDVLSDPYALASDPKFQGPRTPTFSTVKKDPFTGQWMCPFIMAGINTKVVRRSHFLKHYPWGNKFEYQETLLCGPGIKGRIRAWLLLLFMGLFLSAQPNSLLKKLLDNKMPKPGEGPDEETRKKGFFVFSFFAVANNQETLKVTLSCKEDPGYGATSKMLAECAICLALEEESSHNFGVITPSVAMGNCLLERLKEKVGIEFKNC